MTGEDLPGTNHIVRYVRPGLVLEDQAGAAGGAFVLRAEETGVSVHWLEAFSPDRENQLAEVRERSRLDRRRNGRYAELNIGTMLRHVEEELHTVRVLHDPLDATDADAEDPSHAQIMGLPAGDSPEAELVGDLIAECVTALHPAVAA